MHGAQPTAYGFPYVPVHLVCLVNQINPPDPKPLGQGKPIYDVFSKKYAWERPA